MTLSLPLWLEKKVRALIVVKVGIFNHSQGVSDVTASAEFLLKNVLADFLVDGGRPQLPPPAEGAEIDRQAVAAIAATLTIQLRPLDTYIAKVSLSEKQICFSYGWICDRWCSTYLLLKSLLQTPVPELPLVSVMEPLSRFRWPESIPFPWIAEDPFAVYSNRVLPWAVLPSVLHEVAHALVDTRGMDAREVEIACDGFAAQYLMGQRKDEFIDIVIVGIVVWQCCLCSYALGSEPWRSTSHPNPVARLQHMLKKFVPVASEVGVKARLMAVAHVIKLARFYEIPALDNRVLCTEHTSLDELLEDLRLCWEP